jgi:PIN domain nuclease of toxin-antitoxin system
MDFESIPLEAAVCASYHKLTKAYHRDPFDRMLIWQAIHLNVPIICKDESIQLYRSEGISVIW